MEQKRETKNPYYPDIQVFLIAIPLISAFNYYLTYSNIQLNGFLLLTFTIDTVQGYLAWLGVRYFILYLDEKCPYEEGALRRIAFQLVSTPIIGLFIISLLTELVSWLAKDRPAPLHFYTRDLFIISIWFFVINGFYIGMHYYREWQQMKERYREEQQVKSEGIVVTHGKKDLRLDFEEFAGFYVDGDYVVACTTEGDQYFLDQSLRTVNEMLPEALFFRLNRQFVIHHQMITGFKRAKNGKILVLLKEHKCFPPEVSVSRTKAPAFKRWFRG